MMMNLRNISLVILLIAYTGTFSFGQIRTVLPANTTGSIALETGQTKDLSFELNTIPKEAAIDSAWLHFVIKDITTARVSLVVDNTGSKPADMRNNRINSQEIVKGTQANTIISLTVNKAFIKTSLDASRLNIRLTANIPNSGLNLYGSDMVNYAPRLIVFYSFRTVPVDWAGSHADAQHSGRTVMRFGGADSVLKFKSKPVASFNKVQSDLVMYKNRIYLTDDGGASPIIYSVDPVTQSKTTVGEFDVSVKMPVIDPFGRLYHSSTNKIESVNLNNFTDRKIAVDLRGSTISATPTSGRDGSLYVPLNNSINAYTPYPQHRLIWKYDMAGDKGPVALSQDGSIAYVINRTGSLVAINTTNGSVLMSKTLAMKDPAEKNEGVTMPLVTSDGRVYVANKLINADMMYIFDSNLQQIRSISGSNISQPVSGPDTLMNARITGTAFFVNSGNLVQSLPQNEKIVAVLRPGLSVRSLVSDLSNNVYCLGNNKLLYSLVNKRLKISPSDLPEDVGYQKAMIAAPDGSLYTTTSSTLYALRASQFSNNYTLKESDRQLNDYVFRADEVSVPDGYRLMGKKILIGTQSIKVGENVTLEPASEIIIQSNAAISFPKGFKVSQGAALSVKKGY